MPKHLRRAASEDQRIILPHCQRARVTSQCEYMQVWNRNQLKTQGPKKQQMRTTPQPYSSWGGGGKRERERESKLALVYVCVRAWVHTCVGTVGLICQYMNEEHPSPSFWEHVSNFTWNSPLHIDWLSI
jgi:hypothetical protein